MNTRTNSQAQKKIVYLFGAGATHAELINLYPAKVADGYFLSKNSLLMANVSKRVCRNAKEGGVITTKVRNLLSPAGLSNIELFISLIEKNEIKSEKTIDNLKRGIERDILERLTTYRLRKFYLHKALMEFHKTINGREKLFGIISLNYDQVLDEAYEIVMRKKPYYCMSLGASSDEMPLLKLHGGFNLEYRGKRLPIITPAINKNYLELPYNFIWGRAVELLIECDILRVIGCSLSQNDVGLLDLLFKAHLGRKKPFQMQMITFDPQDNNIKENYGFLPRIQRALEIEGGIISDQTISDPSTGSNPFKIWLKAKIQRTMRNDKIRKTTYMKKILE